MMIEVEDVVVKFQDHEVLKRVACSLKEKKIAIIGANGSGKSTFIRLLNGLLLPTSGSVVVDGLNTKTDGKAVRQKVGFVFQNPDHQIVMPVVEEDLAFGLKNLSISKLEITKRIDEVLKHYCLEDKRYESAHLLSGGQKQLLAICGVLVMQPDIILFDEPTTQLDLCHKRQISKVMNRLNQQIVVISHDLHLLEDFDRVLVFDNGQIVCDDVPAKAFSVYESMMS